MMSNFSTRTTRIGTRLLVSTLALAAANAAHAQVTGGGGNSYDAGDPVVVSGSVAFDRTETPNTETYTINSNTAVLDFIANATGPGGPINFQFAGTLAQYLGGLGITDFTVLNRILAADPSRAIQLNGTIISRLQASPTTPGGSVWFYSPGGIIVGSTAVIDVGNLLLATGDPTGGSGVITTPNQFTINSAPDSNAAITVQAGAQITASNAGSYIALVAPAITQSGTVSTNGSAAYVAAEQTTLTFNSGLFNIQTTVGSNANNNTPLVHNGTTRFIDDSGQRRAYLVAVPKNDAITMLIQGNGQLGFDTATGVNVENGAVILSGNFSEVADTTANGIATFFRSDIEITSGAFNGNVGIATGGSSNSEIRILADGNPISFAGDLFTDMVMLSAPSATGSTSLRAQNGGSISIAGQLDVGTVSFNSPTADVAGASIILDASGGDISVGGNTTLLTVAQHVDLGGPPPGAVPAGATLGGNILISTNNANAITFGGDLNATVQTRGADQLTVSQTSSGHATGGNIVFQTGDGLIDVIGNTTLNANATAGTVQVGDATAGNATGGAVTFQVTAGTANFGGNLNINTTGTGGQVNASGTTSAGNGTGGQINFTAGSRRLSVAGNLTADVTGFGGSTQFATSRGGGIGTGGSIVMSGIGTGSIDVSSNLVLVADGLGSAAVGSGTNGGSGTGGSIQILSQAGTMNFGGNVSMNAFGTGGGGLNGGIGTGGRASIFADAAGTINIANQVTMTAIGRGGQGDGVGNAGGFGQGGTAEIFAHGTINLTGSYTGRANGGGGSGINGSNGGAGQSGTVAVISDGGAIAFSDSVSLFGAANGGNIISGNGSAGNAIGGTYQMIARNGGAIQIAGNSSGFGATVSASGIAGSGLFGSASAGNGFGGIAQVIAENGGSIDISGSLQVSASGFGGGSFFDPSSQYADLGGNGTGGTVNIIANAGTITGTSTLGANNQGVGGLGVVRGGDGAGGTINIQAIDGLLDFSSGTDQQFLNVSGIGGNAVDETDGAGNILRSGGDGGNGTGGFAQIFASAGSVDIGGPVEFDTTGQGGDGVSGGFGTGGRASIFADSAGTINFADQVTMIANGRGGQSDGAGNKGGFGQGGTAEILASGTINIIGSYLSNSTGIGGTGANGADGGDALGGVSSVIADGGVVRFEQSAQIRGRGFGGNIISGNGSGGNAQGGLGQMIARNGGNLQILDVDGIANISSTGFGGDGLYGSGSGGNAIGGTSNVIAESGGTIDIAGRLLVTASGLGGREFFDPNVGHADLGGDGTGGTVNILANGGNIIGTSNVSALANGHGGIGVVEGGTGTGGTVNVQAIDGLLDFSNGTGEMFLSMSGFGGDAVAETDGAGNILRGGGNGGDGIGGTITLLAGLFGGADGLTGILRMGDLRISENAATPLGLSGIGGMGAAGASGQDGGDGGDAFAGVVRIGTNNGSSQFTAGNITVGNRAIGGIGGDGQNGGDGGDAFGRQTAIGTFSQIGTNTGGSMTAGNIAVNGSGLGGNGGAGLNGAGGIGGDSLVGAPELFTTLASAFLIGYSNPFTFTDATLIMDSTGGDGGIGTSGRAAGGIAAGFGGGIVSRRATDNVGSNGQVFGNNLITQAISTGGLGAGDARAASNRGFALLNAIDGNISLNNVIFTDGALAPNQDNITSYIRSGNGFVQVTGLVNVNASGDFGLFGLAGGDIDLARLDLIAGGTILFEDPRTPGAAVPDILTIDEVNAVLGGDFIFADDIEIGGNFNLTAGGRIQTGAITAGAGIALQAGSSITTGNLLSAGNISLTGMADEVAGLPASIFTGNITSQAGLINVVTNIGDITLGNLSSLNRIVIDAGNGSTNANAGGDIVIGTVQGSDVTIFGTKNLATGDIISTFAVRMGTVGAISAGNISGGGNVSLVSGNGGITISNIQAGNNLFVNTNGAIQTGNITAGGTAGLVSGNFNTLVGGSSITTGSINAAGQSDIRAFGQIRTGNISTQSLNMFSRTGIVTGDLVVSGGLISLGTTPDAGGPNADIVTGSVQNANGSVFIRANRGSVRTNSITSGDGVEIAGSASVTLSGTINAARSAIITTDGLASFGGLVGAPLISVTSGDINIGANGGLGGANTDDLQINAVAPGQPIIFGGDGSGGGYNLNATEATKLRSRTIRFDAQQVSGAAPADITIRDFTMQGSLAGSGANLLASDLVFTSPGNIRVTGAIRIENAGIEDGLFLSAPSGRVEVVTDLGGSIALVGGAGGLGGNLYLDARHIAVGKADLLTRLAADPRFAGRDAEVNAPDGSNRPEGYISANSILANGFETLIIQNSGTAALRGGFSAGTGGFVLDSPDMAAGAVDAVINGRVADGSGGFLTNDNTSRGLTIEDPAPFSAGSTVNGCLLAGGGCPVVEPPIVPEPSTPEQPSTPDESIGAIASDVRGLVQEQGADEPSQDEEERAAELTPAATSKKSPIAPNIPVVNTGRLDSSPAVDDPITGSGNPNLIGGQLNIEANPSPGSTNDGDS